jgi:hypothetical protein
MHSSGVRARALWLVLGVAKVLNCVLPPAIAGAIDLNQLAIGEGEEGRSGSGSSLYRPWGSEEGEEPRATGTHSALALAGRGPRLF